MRADTEIIDKNKKAGVYRYIFRESYKECQVFRQSPFLDEGGERNYALYVVTKFTLCFGKETGFFSKYQRWAFRKASTEYPAIQLIFRGEKARPLGRPVVLILRTRSFLILRRVYVGLNYAVDKRVEFDFWP